MKTRECKRIVEVVNGNKIKIEKECDIEVIFNFKPNTTYRIVAAVLPGFTHTLVLGMSFIKNNGVIIDFKMEYWE